MKFKLILVCILFCFSFADIKDARSQMSLEDLQQLKNETPEKRIYKRIEKYYLQSLVSVDRFVPLIQKNSFDHRLYMQIFNEQYPELSDALKINTADKLYDISKYKETPLVYSGLPPYLYQPEFSEEDKTISKISPDIGKIIKDNKLAKFFKVTEKAEDAKIFLIPVNATSSLMISNPYVLRRPHRNIYKKYSTIFSDLKSIFFNASLFTLNKEGLPGMLVRDLEGNILSSYCAIHTERSEEEIKEDIFYCLVQSQGLSGFYSISPNYHEKSVAIAKMLLTIHNCDQIKPKDNFFDVSFDDEFYKKCLTDENVKEFKNGYR